MTAAILAIATVVLLITILRVHPFLALILGSAVLGTVAGMPPSSTVDSFASGVGATVGSVGLLIALGAMIGALLADSGGADRLVDAIVDRVPSRWLPWAMGGVAALIGLPLFFEVGVVLLVPVIVLVARRIEMPVMKIGIPALAGLSVLHGLVPPHPGPLVAISVLNADLGLTLAFGLVIAVPALIVAGPIFGSIASRFVRDEERATLAQRTVGRSRKRPVAIGSVVELDVVVSGAVTAAVRRPVPGVMVTAATMLLPIVLMLLRAFGELFLGTRPGARALFDVAGTPIVALLAGVIFAAWTLGRGSGLTRDELSDSLGGALPPIAGILLIVAAGGGFKQTLVDAGVGAVVVHAAHRLALSPLILGWLLAVGIRLATGSATVATTTAAGIVAPLAVVMDRSEVALLALAIGSGSLFFSHVNDAGFWLVKEYFGLSIGETLKTWSVMETIISMVGLAGVLALRLFV